MPVIISRNAGTPERRTPERRNAGPGFRSPQSWRWRPWRCCWLSAPAGAQTLVDYDSDDNRLIEITTLAQLSAIRHDLDGNGDATHADYVAAFPDRDTNAQTLMGCPDGMACQGYELMADLDFDENGDGTVDADDHGGAYHNGGAGWAPIGATAPRAIPPGSTATATPSPTSSSTAAATPPPPAWGCSAALPATRGSRTWAWSTPIYPATMKAHPGGQHDWRRRLRRLYHRAGPYVPALRRHHRQYGSSLQPAAGLLFHGRGHRQQRLCRRAGRAAAIRRPGLSPATPPATPAAAAISAG